MVHHAHVRKVSDTRQTQPQRQVVSRIKTSITLHVRIAVTVVVAAAAAAVVAVAAAPRPQRAVMRTLTIRRRRSSNKSNSILYSDIMVGIHRVHRVRGSTDHQTDTSTDRRIVRHTDITGRHVPHTVLVPCRAMKARAVARMEHHKEGLQHHLSTQLLRMQCMVHHMSSHTIKH